MQTSATPIPTPTSMEEACGHLDITKHNAVVNEKSRQDGMDMNAQTNAALRHVFAKLESDQNARKHVQTERIEFKTGNMMVASICSMVFWCSVSNSFYTQRWIT